MKYRKIIGTAMAVMMAVTPLIPEQYVSAKTLMIEENGEAAQIEASDVSIYIDGVLQEGEEKQGIMHKDECMVSCSFLETVLGMKVQIADEGKILLQKYDSTIQMQIGSKAAIVNEKEYTLNVEPFVNQNENKEEIYVPMSFVLEQIHYTVQLEQVSEGAWNARVQSTLLYTCDGEEKYYNGDSIETLSIDGKVVSLKDSMPGIELDGVMLLPLEQAVANETVNAVVTASGSGIAVKHGTNIVEVATNSSIAVVNGVEKQMETSVKVVKYKEKEYLMVPAEFLFLNLGANKVEIDRSAKKITVSGLISSTIDKSKNYVKNVKISKQSKRDAIILTCKKTPKFQVKSSATQIKITLKNVTVEKNAVRKLTTTKYTTSFRIKQSGKNVIVVLKKKKGVNFITQYGSGKVCIYVGVTPVRITVDCGHGANTPGKRTPKMPCNIDFNGDGKIDIRKGQSIKEHQANVGVGKKLANELERLGFKVNRCAFGSADISLSARQRSIKNFKSKYSISVHFNAAGNGMSFNSANGVEVYYHSKYFGKSSKGLAKSVLSQMAKGTRQLNRGTKSQILALCNTRMTGAEASILVECAFMTNLREAKTMVGNKKFWDETGTEIARGVCNYAGMPYVAE